MNIFENELKAFGFSKSQAVAISSMLCDEQNEDEDADDTEVFNPGEIWIEDRKF